MKKISTDEAAIKIKGFFRLQITEDQEGKPAKIVGDSGWRENSLTNEGFDDYLCRLIAAQASSKQIGYIALGTGTAPNATHATLNGELGGSTKRKAVTVSVSNSKTVRFTATFGSTDSFLAGQSTLQNIGLYDNNATNGAMFAGSTYPTSTCDSNQNVNVTYDIQFS